MTINVTSRASDPPTAGWLRAKGEADLTLWLPGDVPLFFRLIPAAPDGFRMGERGQQVEAEPIHTVRIARAFYLGTFPVTQHQYRAVAARWPDLRLDRDPSHLKERGDFHPVEQVSWDDAVRWCAGVHERCVDGALRWTTKPGSPSLGTIERIALPSEAEWEYACRAGTETEYWSGDGEAALAEVGWYQGNSEDSTRPGGRKSTHPVGEKDAANPWGLHDMHGNVDEWCEDVFHPRAYRKRVEGWAARAWTAADAGEDATEYGQRSGAGTSNPDRVIRGGSWSGSARYCRSAFRNRWWPDNRFGDLGFRCCLFPGPVAQAQKSHRAEAEPAA
ncbi:MAG: formylglycine-generating enzyme family protein [Phycisphaerales bacterium]